MAHNWRGWELQRNGDGELTATREGSHGRVTLTAKEFLEPANKAANGAWATIRVGDSVVGCVGNDVDHALDRAAERLEVVL